MKKLLPLFAFILLPVAGCNTSSSGSSPADEVVTLAIVHGWCMPACNSEFTITPEETTYIEINPGEDPKTQYSAKTDPQDWQKIALYLKNTDYRNIETEPTCNVCVDGNDYILNIHEDGRDKTIYYTGGNEVQRIEDFMADLIEMREEFVALAKVEIQD